MNNILCKHYAGSIAYGTNLPTSDVDFRGLFFEERFKFCSPFLNPRTEWEDKSEEDTKYYEMTEFLRRYVDASPDVIETLWVDDKFIVESSEVYEYLQSKRQELLSSKVQWTFTGYAREQFKRIKGHNKWINNPQPEEPPVRRDYVKLVRSFQEDRLMPKDFSLSSFNEGWALMPYSGDVKGLYRLDGSRTLNSDGSIHKSDYETLSTALDGKLPELIVRLDEESYSTQKASHKNYWAWVKNRNAARSELEYKHGYDTKHGMHVVRLLRSCEEMLNTGDYNVFREDAEELKAIRNGAWSYDELIEYYGHQLDVIATAAKTTDLPKAVDRELAQGILSTAQEMVWNG